MFFVSEHINQNKNISFFMKPNPMNLYAVIYILYIIRLLSSFITSDVIIIKLLNTQAKIDITIFENCQTTKVIRRYTISVYKNYLLMYL